ncbi:ribonuclease H [Senna tora]|uniref:Ribonuclease H n=1 Tax=Senna tora TaxID=362788 RepID=A0A834TV11_9FABA|nr:ribonuclease H [Senna tora]
MKSITTSKALRETKNPVAILIPSNTTTSHTILCLPVGAIGIDFDPIVIRSLPPRIATQIIPSGISSDAHNLRGLPKIIELNFKDRNQSNGVLLFPIKDPIVSLFPDKPNGIPEFCAPTIFRFPEGSNMAAISKSVETSLGEKVASSTSVIITHFPSPTLMDMGFSGPKFTWGRQEVKERLDWAFINQEGRVLFPEAHVTHLPELKSDHRPILISLNLSDQSEPGSRPFCFQAGWLSDKSFPSLIERTWCDTEDWAANAKIFTEAVKDWNKDQFDNLIDVPFPLTNCFLALSDSSLNRIQAPISDEEVKRAVFSIGAFKAPGPDGFQAIFFHSQWHIVGKSVCSLIKNIFTETALIAEINQLNAVSFQGDIAVTTLSLSKKLSIP